jgi:hypothetical protein
MEFGDFGQYYMIFGEQNYGTNIIFIKIKYISFDKEFRGVYINIKNIFVKNSICLCHTK